jgi:hypothetical protein
MRPVNWGQVTAAFIDDLSTAVVSKLKDILIVDIPPSKGVLFDAFTGIDMELSHLRSRAKLVVDLAEWHNGYFCFEVHGPKPDRHAYIHDYMPVVEEVARNTGRTLISLRCVEQEDVAAWRARGYKIHPAKGNMPITAELPGA